MMRTIFSALFLFAVAALSAVEAAPAVSGKPADTAAVIDIPTAAVLPFESRTRAGETRADGKSTAELLSVALLESGKANLVERAELEKVLDELQLSAIGMVDKASQVKLGKLTGAKLLITGSLFTVGEKNFIVTKIISTETSRVLGCSVSGREDFDTMIPALTNKVLAILDSAAERLLPPRLNEPTAAERLSTLDGDNRTVFVKITEDIQVAAPDPAATTALRNLLLRKGFLIVENQSKADFSILGEAVASQTGNYRKFTGAQARVELSIHDRRNRVLATGAARETMAGATYVIAAKEALAQCTLNLAVELLPVLGSVPAQR